MKVKRVKNQKTSALTNAVSNVTKIIKKKEKALKTKVENVITKSKADKGIIKSITDKENEKKKTEKVQLTKKSRKIQKEEIPYRSTKGIVYIGHIPYGFFEDEMKEYFEQFGKVTRVRVARSEKTGRSRGYGYIEFENRDVAKIAAETMNNYLMCGRLLKATYIPPEKQHWGFFSGKPWTAKIYPKIANRMNELRKNESPINEKRYKKGVGKKLTKLSILEKKLKSKGVDIKIKPVDVPN